MFVCSLRKKTPHSLTHTHARNHQHTTKKTPTKAGHAGYEIAPFIPTLEGAAALLAALLSRGGKGSTTHLNTVQHHDLHHRFPSRHFSLYFTHWDRWCGTLHPKYDANLFRYFSSSPSSSAAQGGGVKQACGVEAAGGECVAAAPPSCGEQVAVAS